jgi:hypothetical protein
MVTDFGGLRESGLRVLAAYGKANKRAGLLVVGGSWSLSRLGKEDKVQS